MRLGALMHRVEILGHRRKDVEEVQAVGGDPVVEMVSHVEEVCEY